MDFTNIVSDTIVPVILVSAWIAFLVFAAGRIQRNRRIAAVTGRPGAGRAWSGRDVAKALLALAVGRMSSALAREIPVLQITIDLVMLGWGLKWAYGKWAARRTA